VPEAGLVLGLLAAVAFLAAIGRRVGLPDPIVFALGGLALAVMPGMPQITLPSSLVLVIFLPPLIFAAAQDTSWAEMRQEARPILLLAVGLVLVTMAAVAAVARALAPELTRLRRSCSAPLLPHRTPSPPRQLPTRFTSLDAWWRRSEGKDWSTTRPHWWRSRWRAAQR
jgi:hypothetical protein